TLARWFPTSQFLNKEAPIFAAGSPGALANPFEKRWEGGVLQLRGLGEVVLHHARYTTARTRLNRCQLESRHQAKWRRHTVRILITFRFLVSGLAQRA